MAGRGADLISSSRQACIFGKRHVHSRSRPCSNPPSHRVALQMFFAGATKLVQIAGLPVKVVCSPRHGRHERERRTYGRGAPVDRIGVGGDLMRASLAFALTAKGYALNDSALAKLRSLTP